MVGSVTHEFTFSSGLVEELLLTVVLTHICVTDVSDGRNHSSFVLGKCLT